MPTPQGGRDLGPDPSAGEESPAAGPPTLCSRPPGPPHARLLHQSHPLPPPHPALLLELGFSPHFGPEAEVACSDRGNSLTDQRSPDTWRWRGVGFSVATGSASWAAGRPARGRPRVLSLGHLLGADGVGGGDAAPLLQGLRAAALGVEGGRSWHHLAFALLGQRGFPRTQGLQVPSDKICKLQALLQNPCRLFLPLPGPPRHSWNLNVSN